MILSVNIQFYNSQCKYFPPSYTHSNIYLHNNNNHPLKQSSPHSIVRTWADFQGHHLHNIGVLFAIHMENYSVILIQGQTRRQIDLETMWTRQAAISPKAIILLGDSEAADFHRTRFRDKDSIQALGKGNKATGTDRSKVQGNLDKVRTLCNSQTIQINLVSLDHKASKASKALDLSRINSEDSSEVHRDKIQYNLISRAALEDQEALGVAFRLVAMEGIILLETQPMAF